MRRPGLFDDTGFGDLFARAFGFGTCAEPPPRVPLRILKLPGDTLSAVTREQVKTAFRTEIFKAHPDLNTYTDPAVRRAAEAVIQDQPDVQELVWARDVLLRMLPLPVTGSNVTAGAYYDPSRFKPKPCRRCGEEYDRDARGWFGRRWAGYCFSCGREGALQRQRDRRRARRADRTCHSCGTTFTPPRSDGRYCSPACRQKAYRRRKGGGPDAA